MADTRLPRMLRVLTLVRSRVARTPKELARICEVSERTIFRDMKALERAKIPCLFDKDHGGYRIQGDFFLPPMQLNFGEAMALSVLASQLGNGRGKMPFLGDAWRAVTKVRSILPPSVRSDVAETDAHVRIDGARVSPQEGCDEQFELVRRSIAGTRKVRCVYRSKKGLTRPFLFRPYTLYFGQRAWYAIGFSEFHGQERSFKLNRFAKIDPTSTPYLIPPDWSLEKCFGNAWRMMKGDRRYFVEIHFDAEFGPTVSETLWHPTQKIDLRRDGSCVFRCNVDGLDEIIWWVMSYGPHARIINPPELRQRIEKLAGAMIQLYSDCKETS